MQVTPYQPLPERLITKLSDIVFAINFGILL